MVVGETCWGLSRGAALAGIVVVSFVAVVGAVQAQGVPTPAAFAETAACKALRAKYPSLAGKSITIGLGGYTVGFESPSADDPNKLVGLDASMFDYMGACLGFSHTFQNGSFNVLVTSIASGRIDTGPSLFVTDARVKQVSFVSTLVNQDDAVVRSGTGKKFTSLESLCGAVVASAAGTFEALNILPSASESCEKAGKPKVEVLLLQATDNGVQAVLSSRADVYLTSHSDAVGLTKSIAGLQTAFTIDLPVLSGYPFNKSNTVLLNAVYDAVQAIQAAGIQKVLLDQWGQGASAERSATIHQ